MSEQVAVYPGFFDPFTLGHLNVVERATVVFDRIIVAVAANSPKAALFSVQERVQLIQQVLKDSKQVQVETFDGLLMNYLGKRNVRVVLRGIRTVSDFEYESQMALANKRLAKEIETMFMMTDAEHAYLSSTLIKEIARLGGDINEMVPPEVVEAMRSRYANQ